MDGTRRCPWRSWFRFVAIAEGFIGRLVLLGLLFLRFLNGGCGRLEGLGDLCLVGQIASQQGVKRDHGIPDFFEFVDRRLLVGRRRRTLS